ncbi:MAG: ATPase/histidine kinase/DNA gyrase B/HSP90 domain protein [Parcubacteria group bacterium GW2011_GWF2_38_76]|nr:MAG: ATPase/histidine kinase/DNA gyrase B/HSP90 domain protein [Parcubacteria group bacterium GW2011_GWF2_38_76]HBM45529.1 hypothetical protein [Patescibacteria group bacterium]
MWLEIIYLVSGLAIGFIVAKVFLDNKNSANDSKEKDFSQATIHELRAYLTNLGWIFEKLIEKGVPSYTDDEYKAISLGKSTVANANNLINDTLAAVSVGRQEARFRFSINDINKMIESIVSEYTMIAKERGIDFTFTSSAVPIPLFFFDNSQMYIAIHDLVHNAMKYTKNGGSINISTKLEEGRVIVTVRDTGIGIPEEEQKNIFTKFFRAKNAKDLYKEGSGLGMYISKNIITRHNGSIKLQSKEGEGTTIEVSLPLLQTEPKENKN